MDKETLSKYGWVVIVIIVLVILMGLAAPFGSYVKNGAISALNSFTSVMASTENNFLNIDAERLNENHFNSPITNYTVEQINADATMYSIGATKSEYVIADFNDDYTEVVITANGENSDGKMKDWDVSARALMQNYPNLKAAIIKNGVTRIGQNAFTNCANLTDISIANSVTSLGKSAFSNCDTLEEVIIPSGVKMVDEYTFYGCDNLTNVIIKEGLTEISNNMFVDCSSLANINIPNSVTRIGISAFGYCYNLTSITIPVSVTAVNNHSFYFTGINDVYYLGTQEQWKNITKIGNKPAFKSDITIHYNT